MTQTGDFFSHRRCDSTLIAVKTVLDVLGH